MSISSRPGFTDGRARGRPWLASICVLAMALAGFGTVRGAGGPLVASSAPATATAGTDASTGSVTWRPVDGPLGGSVPGFTVGATEPVAWSKGFAVLEDEAYIRNGADRSITWRDPAVWLSADGQTWTRHRLPRAIVGRELSLLTWQDGLSVIEHLPRERGWRFRLWSSGDGGRWHRAGTFDQRPVGRLDGCAFTYPHVVSTASRIVAMASCVPYANGRAGTPFAALSAVEPSDYRSPIWAWTTGDGTHWSRHLVTDDLDAAGAVRVPVLVEAFGEGFAAVMCCYPPSVWWSEDGTRWREIMGLPSEVAYQDVAALGALLRDGRPGTWLLLGDKDHEIGEGGFTGALGTLWTGDGSSWTEVASQPGWEDGRIATDGDIAVVATVKILELDELDRPRLRLDTLASTDGGRSWESSQGEELMPDGCCLGGIALHDDRALLAGPWGPDSVSLRRADIYGSAP